MMIIIIIIIITQNSPNAFWKIVTPEKSTILWKISILIKRGIHR